MLVVGIPFRSGRPMSLIVAVHWVLVGLLSNGRSLPLQSKYEVGIPPEHFARMLDLSVDPPPGCYCGLFDIICEYQSCVFPFVRVHVFEKLDCNSDPIISWVGSVSISFRLWPMG
jgi:hypothetical protein